MSRTYAAYQRQPDGTWFRLGTFRGPRGSVRNVTAAFAARHPRADLATIAFASRQLVCGRWCDGERVPAEVAAAADVCSCEDPIVHLPPHSADADCERCGKPYRPAAGGEVAS